MPIQKQNVTLFLPALGILALYLFTRLFSMESGLEETAAALLGFGALACFAHGERLASDPARSLKQSIFWGFGERCSLLYPQSLCCTRIWKFSLNFSVKCCFHCWWSPALSPGHWGFFGGVEECLKTKRNAGTSGCSF